MPSKPHYHKPTAGQHNTRGNASERGYDTNWQKLRQEYAAANPLCEHCKQKGITTPMREVDHIIPFDGPDDPLRLSAGNLQSLCRACHATKTHDDKRNGR